MNMTMKINFLTQKTLTKKNNIKGKEINLKEDKSKKANKTNIID